MPQPRYNGTGEQRCLWVQNFQSQRTPEGPASRPRWQLLYCNQRPLWVSSRMQTSFIGAFNKQSNVIEHFHYACVSRICSAIMDVLNVSSLRFSYTVYHGVDGVVVLLNERTPLPLHGLTFSLCFNLCWTHHSSTSRLHPKHLPSQEDNNPTPTVSGTIDTENG